MSKWIEFEEEEVIPGRKTKLFFVWTKGKGQCLGDIRWYGPWRKYCFYPCQNTIFETQCLTDIIEFIKKLMEERKNAKANSDR